MPGSIRLFVSAHLTAGAEIAATPAQAHYLATVMRRGVGESVRLFNAEAGEWRARVATIGRGAATLVAETLLRPPEAEPDVWLAFALLKRDATDLVVQKATELGVAALWPVRTQRTQAERMNPTRLLAIATEAAEQCERLSVPVLHPLRPLGALLDGWPADRVLSACLERAALPALQPSPARAGLLVGPEGGFSPDETALLLAHPAVCPVSLGPRVLRAETACIVGLALLQASR